MIWTLLNIRSGSNGPSELSPSSTSLPSLSDAWYVFNSLTSRTPAYNMTFAGDENASSSAEEVAQAIRYSCFCQPSLLILRPIDVRRFSWLVYPWVCRNVARLCLQTQRLIALVFLGVSAELVGIRPSFALDLVAIVNAASAVGRLGSGVLALSFGAVNTMAIFTTLAAALTYTWGYVSTEAAFTVVTILYG